MRIITWNMAAGFGFDATRHERSWRCLLELDADVALVQEAVIPSWASTYWSSRVAARKYAPIKGKTDVAWGSAVLAKIGDLEAAQPAHDSWLKELWGSVAVGRLDAGPWFASIHSNAYPLTTERLGRLPLGEIRRCHDEKLWEIEIIAASWRH